jgi:hypothetical protein
MVSKSRFGKFAIVFAAVMVTVTGFSGVSHGTGFIVGQHKIALDIVMPKDKAAFKAGENVHVTVKSSGFTGVKIVAKDTATGAQEELKATLVKSEGSGSLAPKAWDALWPTAGRKPGSYAFTVTGLGGDKATPVAKTVTISVVQPSGPAKITFTEPAGGRQVKAGEDVRVVVKASGVSKVDFFVKDLQAGTEKPRPSAHAAGSDSYSTSWSTQGLQKGTYQIIARGLGTDGKKLAEESVTLTVTGGAPALKPQAAATPVMVPNVVGMSEYRAVVALDKAGLKINPAKYVSTAKQDLWGVVVEQSVKAGTKTAEPVTITVGRK